MTGIVGRNDYGKSTFLEALTIFLETEGARADKSDMNCFSLADGVDQFEIACELTACQRRWFWMRMLRLHGTIRMAGLSLKGC